MGLSRRNCLRQAAPLRPLACTRSRAPNACASLNRDDTGVHQALAAFAALSRPVSPTRFRRGSNFLSVWVAARLLLAARNPGVPRQPRRLSAMGCQPQPPSLPPGHGPPRTATKRCRGTLRQFVTWGIGDDERSRHGSGVRKPANSANVMTSCARPAAAGSRMWSPENLAAIVQKLWRLTKGVCAGSP